MGNITISNETSTNSMYRQKGFYLSNLAIFLFVLFLMSQRSIDLVLRSNIIQVIAVLVVLVCLFFKPSRNRTLQYSLTRIDALWTNAILIMLVYITIDGILKNNNHIFTYTTAIIFLFLVKVDIDKFKSSFKLLKVGSIIYASITIFQYLFTDLFHSILFPLVQSTVQTRILELVHLNYYPGLGFAEPAIAAGFMVVGIGIILSGLEFRTKSEKRIDLVLLLLLCIGLIMTGKRSIMVWAIIAMLVTYYYSANLREKLNRMIKIIVSFLLVLIVLVLAINIFSSTPFFSRIIETIDGIIAGEDITSGRLILYDGAWKIFMENPIFGIGWGQFIVVTSGKLLARDLAVHNVYLQLLTEMGIVGFLVIIIPFIYVYSKTFKLLKLLSLKNVQEQYLWKLGITFSFFFQTFFLLYCLTENPFYNMIYIYLYFYSIAIPNSFLIFVKGKKRSLNQYF